MLTLVTCLPWWVRGMVKGNRKFLDEIVNDVLLASRPIPRPHQQPPQMLRMREVGSELLMCEK
jgi:hypothetical protein